MSFCPAADKIVTELALDCLGLFETSCGDNVPMPVPQLIDQRGRFRIWLSDLGVFNHGNKSLEYRLIWDVGTRQGVAILLQNLRDDLKELQTIESRIRADDRPSLEITTKTVILKQKSVYEYQVDFMTVLKAVEKDVDVLRSLANSIRKADKYPNENIDENQRIGDKLEVNDEAWLASINRELELMFPMADPFVRNRLEDTMFRRWKWFRHRKHHRRGRGIRLSGAVQSPSKTTVSSQASSDLAVCLVVGQDPTHVSAMTGTSPGQSHIDMPPLPKVYGNVELICPYCMIILPLPQTDVVRKWTEHLQEDLDPYVCLIDNCSRPTVLYSTKDEWLRHIKQEHMKRWVCRVRSHKVTIFDSELKFVEHMNQYHTRTFHSAQLELLKTKSTCYTGQIFKSCPICGQSNFRDGAEAEGHVAAHLVTLASKCFPMEEEDNTVLQSMASSYINLVDVFLPKSVETAFHSAQAENIKLQDFNKDENHPEVEASLDLGMSGRLDCVIRVLLPPRMPAGRGEPLAQQDEDRPLHVGLKHLYPADESIFEDLVLRSTVRLNRMALQVESPHDGTGFQDTMIVHLCALHDGIASEKTSDHLSNSLILASRSLTVACSLNRTMKVVLLSGDPTLRERTASFSSLITESAHPPGLPEIQIKFFLFNILKESLRKALHRLQEVLTTAEDGVVDNTTTTRRRKSVVAHSKHSDESIPIPRANIPNQSLDKISGISSKRLSGNHISRNSTRTSRTSDSGVSALSRDSNASRYSYFSASSACTSRTTDSGVSSLSRASHTRGNSYSGDDLARTSKLAGSDLLVPRPASVEYPRTLPDFDITTRPSPRTEPQEPDDDDTTTHHTQHSGSYRPLGAFHELETPESSPERYLMPMYHTDRERMPPLSYVPDRRQSLRTSATIGDGSYQQSERPIIHQNEHSYKSASNHDTDRIERGNQAVVAGTRRPLGSPERSYNTYTSDPVGYGKRADRAYLPDRRTPDYGFNRLRQKEKKVEDYLDSMRGFRDDPSDFSAEWVKKETRKSLNTGHTPSAVPGSSYRSHRSHYNISSHTSNKGGTSIEFNGAFVDVPGGHHVTVNYSPDSGRHRLIVNDGSTGEGSVRGSAHVNQPRLSAVSNPPSDSQISGHSGNRDPRGTTDVRPSVLTLSREWLPPFTMMLLLARTFEECQHLILTVPADPVNLVQTRQELSEIEDKFCLLIDVFHQRFGLQKQTRFNFAACYVEATGVEKDFLENMDQLANESRSFLRNLTSCDGLPPGKDVYRSRLVARFLLSFLHSEDEDEVPIAGLREVKAD